jgi:hypothetical protein
MQQTKRDAAHQYNRQMQLNKNQIDAADQKSRVPDNKNTIATVDRQTSE